MRETSKDTDAPKLNSWVTRPPSPPRNTSRGQPLENMKKKLWGRTEVITNRKKRRKKSLKQPGELVFPGALLWGEVPDTSPPRLAEQAELQQQEHRLRGPGLKPVEGAAVEHHLGCHRPRGGGEGGGGVAQQGARLKQRVPCGSWFPLPRLPKPTRATCNHSGL